MSDEPKYTREQIEAAAELCAIAGQFRREDKYTGTWDAAQMLHGRYDFEDPVQQLADKAAVRALAYPGLTEAEAYFTAAAELLSGVLEAPKEIA